MKTFVCAALMLPTVVTADGASVSFLTEDYAPYSWMADGQAKGHAIDLINEVAERAALSHTVEITKWTRAIALAEKDASTCVFSTARTAEREDKFQWAGPMYVEGMYLIQNAGTNGEVTSLEQALTKSIGTQVGDFTVDLLEELGAAKVDAAPDLDKTMKKLAAGRLDYVILGQESANALTAADAGLEIAMEVSRDEYFIACSHDTPAAVVAEIDAAMDSLMTDGTQAEIVSRY
ncbi:substrate-binding periplasmic protein [Shimia sagamensis]|uniref:Amino acid ABC transporter substrate-binding protein, PAAT family n=1 Tax=Shimia sagamensis TaxID=1566352 RepID=A0ABY1P335_9RHOB|nr:transporter substrate-binding domain-containing protein [Shimia sagamensis]SMP23689.1 amino acid ABC transporter substrate-binding protein, PAAT family [Shimia sagamensis]